MGKHFIRENQQGDSLLRSGRHWWRITAAAAEETSKNLKSHLAYKKIFYVHQNFHDILYLSHSYNKASVVRSRLFLLSK